jgi:hypothetical protein
MARAGGLFSVQQLNKTVEHEAVPGTKRRRRSRGIEHTKPWMLRTSGPKERARKHRDETLEDKRAMKR